MLSSKDKRYLKSLAMKMEPIFQIGKEGIGENQLRQLDETLEARELIKITVLRTAMQPVKKYAELLSGELRADTVQTIGKKIVLFRPSQKKPRILLPSAKD